MSPRREASQVRASTGWRTMAGARDMLARMTPSNAAPDSDLTSEQRRALEMLAGSPHGTTDAVLRWHGFSVGLLAGLMRAGLAKAEAETTQAGGRVRIRITDAGQRALAG
jgi:hypothetical protein